MSRPMRMRRRESGSTLIMSLVLLVVLTLIVLTNILMTNVNSRIAGNMQYRSEAETATQQAVEQVISSNFTLNPQPATVPVDVNNDGVADYTVQVARPNCLSALPIKQNQLDPSVPDDAACLADGSVQNAGIVGAGGAGNSNCSNTQWDVKAGVSDANTGVNITVHQGIGVRVAVGTSC